MNWSCVLVGVDKLMEARGMTRDAKAEIRLQCHGIIWSQIVYRLCDQADKGCSAEMGALCNDGSPRPEICTFGWPHDTD